MKQDFFAFGINQEAFEASASTFKEKVKEVFTDIQTSVADIKFTPTMGSGLTALTTSASEAATAMAKVTAEFNETVLAAQKVQDTVMTTKIAFDNFRRAQADMSISNNQISDSYRKSGESMKEYHDMIQGYAAKISTLAKSETSGAEAATQRAIKNYDVAVSYKARASAEEMSLAVQNQQIAANEVMIAALAQESAANYEYAAALEYVEDASNKLEGATSKNYEKRAANYVAAEQAERSAFVNKEQAAAKVQVAQNYIDAAKKSSIDLTIKEEQQETKLQSIRNSNATKEVENQMMIQKAKLELARQELVTAKQNVKGTNGKDEVANNELKAAAARVAAEVTQMEVIANERLAAATNQVAEANVRVEETRGNFKEQQAALAEQSRANREAAEAETELSRVQTLNVTTQRDIKNALEETGGKAQSFRGALRGMYGELRMIAYILPGIGIAGIFQAAFTALGELIGEMDLFKNKIVEENKAEKELTETLIKKWDIQKKIDDDKMKVYQVTNTSSSDNLSNASAEDAAGGTNKLIIAQQKANIEETKLDELKKGILTYTSGKEGVEFNKERNAFLDKDGSLDFVKIAAASEKNEAKISELNKKLNGDGSKKGLNQILDDDIEPAWKVEAGMASREASETQYGGAISKGNIDRRNAYNKAMKGDRMFEGKYIGSQEQLKSDKETAESQMKLAETQQKYVYEPSKKIVDQTKSTNEAEVAAMREYDVIKRNMTEESLKHELEKKKLAITERLAKEYDSEKAKIEDVRNLRSIDDQLAKVERDKITKDKSVNNKNVNTDDVILAAENKYSETRLKNKLDEEKSIFEIKSSYALRLRAANKESYDVEIEDQIKYQEEQYKNTDKSMKERLQALSFFIADKKAKIDSDHKEETADLYVEGKGYQKKTKEEIKVADDKQKSSTSELETSSILETKEIVKSSLAKILKDEEDAEKLSRENYKTGYEAKINDLSDHYSKRIAFLFGYTDKVRQMEDNAKSEELQRKLHQDKLITDDSEFELSNAKNRKKDSEKGVKSAQDKLDTDSSMPFLANSEVIEKDKKELEKAKGVDSETGDALKNQELHVKENVKTEENDAEKVQKDKQARLVKMESLSAKNAVELAKSTANLIKSIEHNDIQEKLRLLEIKKGIIDEEYQYEIDAVNKSSLNKRDKSALDIQLTEQKREFDKEAAREARALKREEAVFDKNMKIEEAIAATAIAIVEALATPGLPPGGAEILAIERAAIGAVQIAAVEAIKIPSYAEGTDYHKGGFARFGEAGAELITEPNKTPYWALQETIKSLPVGTKVEPVSNFPSFEKPTSSDGWEQTRWLAKMLKPQKEKNKTSTIIVNVDGDIKRWKNSKLGL